LAPAVEGWFAALDDFRKLDHQGGGVTRSAQDFCSIVARQAAFSALAD
jgi:hypothetical protein